jgi:ABC-type transport system involved in multi-copper enzyme maturation permease subunit
MDKIWPIASITLREGIRNRALQGILAIALFLGFVYLTIIPMFAFDTGKVAVDLGFASITLAGLAIVIFLGIGMLTRDIHQRSVCMILSRPVTRSEYVVGKFCGLSVTIFIAMGIIAVIAVGTSLLGILLIPEMTAPRNFSILMLLTVLAYQFESLLILLAVAFFFTVLTTNEFLSMLFTFCVYVIGHSLETVVRVITAGEFVHVGPAYLQVMRIMTWIFPNLNAFDLKVHVAYGLPLHIGQVTWTAAYGIFYIVVMLSLTNLIFLRKEIR